MTKILSLISLLNPNNFPWLVLRLIWFILASFFVITTSSQAPCAENLKLRSGISFVQDTYAGFPIIASKMEDCTIEPGIPTFIFFGAGGDLNTNRQAERVIRLYKRYWQDKLKFLLVDVDHPTSAQAISLIKNYYKGYIPCQVVLTKTGVLNWSQTGEVDTKVLKSQLEAVLP